MLLPPAQAKYIDDLMRADLLYWRDLWFGWLLLSTKLVVVGLILEGPELIHELFSIRGRVRIENSGASLQESHIPDWVRIVAFLGWFFIVVGVAGEWIADAMVSDADSNLQTFASINLAEAQKEAGYAIERAAVNELEAAQLRKDAESERLARVKLEKEVAWRRLTGEQKVKFTASLKQYPDPVGIVVVSALLDSESSDFADDFDAAITDAKWKTLRLRDRLTRNTGISLGVFEGTPELDPWNRPILKLKKRIGDALKAIGIQYHDVTFGKDDLRSTGTPFQPGPIYLVIEHKPPVAVPVAEH